ncbi:MAG TPA: hypothetical protein VMN39_08650 [Longimicrobiaceae bacterium]|nr:hypothetical protein [Longimicrobiaceae bacterium]
MVPTLVLVVSFLVFLALGRLGGSPRRDWRAALRRALALMFLVTASAHFGPGREDLIRMVPPLFPLPALLVTLTGVLEILGALALLIPRLAGPAAVSLAVLLAAMFPANVYAARQGLELMGEPVTPLLPRTLMQIVFIGALLAAAELRRIGQAEVAR